MSNVLWCSYTVSQYIWKYNTTIIYTEAVTPFQLFLDAWIVTSKTEYKQVYHSLRIHSLSIDEWMEDEENWRTFPPYNILLYKGKIPKEIYIAAFYPF